jgi:acyl-CoA reductase-like NAD-dependent aldehyde dehydrogenase
MCTAPQNVFIQENIESNDGVKTFDEVATAISEAVKGIAHHPKMGAGTLGGIQNDSTLKRIRDAGNFGGEVLAQSEAIANPDFENSRTFSPLVVKLSADQEETYSHECFGPVLLLIKTKTTEDSVQRAAKLAKEQGAITCLAFSTDEHIRQHIENEMNQVFTPVSFNLSGAGFVNQHAAFSDFHVSGGNPAGNASFSNPEYINKRFVWVGNRYM